MPRVQRRFLLHSRWTAVVDVDGLRHFEVVAIEGDVVTLRAVLTRTAHRLSLAELDDPGAWELGWRSLV